MPWLVEQTYVGEMNMRGFLWLALKLALGAFTMANAQGIAQWETGTPPPLHPTIIEGEYKGKSLPIVSVVRDTPQVEVDGKLKHLTGGSKTSYLPKRGARFAPGSIELRSMKVNSSKTKMVLMFRDGGQVDSGPVSESSEFFVTVVPTQDYHECYVALIFFDQGYIEGTTDQPGASVQFEAIKPLVGGKENKIKLDFGFVDFGARATGFFPIFFTRGLEIRSDQCELIARFFRHREMSIHEQILKSYQSKNASQSVALKPYLQIPPLVPDEMIPATPLSIPTTFMVSEAGTVESLQFEGADVPTSILAPLRRSLNGWLFLPRLKDGRPVRTFVRVPILLQQTADENGVKSSG